ncbi:hypothetical protein V3C21_24810, partial [Salmonella enterica subsp. enterica serovar Paratyphi B]|uniref:hypothetical protein n=1 Tax=Salmonella enterica TaxID=28901 RepID=UPI0030C7A129
LQDSEGSRQQHNQAYADAMLEAHADFFTQIESSPLNPSQARAVVNGESSLLLSLIPISEPTSRCVQT